MSVYNRPIPSIITFYASRNIVLGKDSILSGAICTSVIIIKKKSELDKKDPMKAKPNSN